MNLSPLPIQKFFGNDGRPLVGGKLFTYLSGTSTKVATYTDAGGLTQNTNPIVLDYRGECNLWIDPQQSYTFVLAPATDTDPPTAPIWTVNAITAGPVSQDNAATDTGSVNAIALSIPQISSPVAFTRIVFKVANTNTGPVTITINGGTAKNLRYQNTAAFAGGEILSGGIYEAVYDGAQWQLQGPAVAYWRTDAEIAASVTPTDYSYPEGTVNRYGPNTTPGTTDMTAAINAAISVGGSVFFLGETYAAQGITANQDYQMFFGQAGTVVKKNANGTLMTVSGNRCGMFNIRFDGAGATYTGSNIVKSGVQLTLLHCSSYAAASRAVLDSDGNGLRIAGTNHVYQTLGATSSDYDIEIAGSGLYAKITDVYTSQSTGGIYVNGASGVSISGGQFGKLTVLTGWAQVVNCRINGDTRIEGSNTQMVNTSHSADVTIGDGSTALSGIIWSPSCIIQSGSTFTVTAGVVDSVIYTEQLTANGATVDLTNISSDNEFYTAWAAYTPTIGAAGGSPTIGNGTITAYAKRRGRVFDASIRLICGSTTDFGTGAITLTMPYIPSSTVKQHGSALLLDAGTQFYTAIGETLADGTSAINILPQAASAVTLNVPFTWTTSDEIRLSMVGVEA